MYVAVGHSDKKDDDKILLEGAELKVLGNANGDRVIDSADIDVIKDHYGGDVAAYPFLDANNDKVIDEKDVQLVNDIIAKKPTKVWHVNFYDEDKNGTMDYQMVETSWPVSSAIMTGSANSFMLCYLEGIITEIKGASYGSTNDKKIFGDNYLNVSKTVKLGTSSTSITFEDGKAGASNVIADENVTCVISDWNRSYLENYANFENAGVDVVRVAAASADPEVYTHSILLLGFLFQKEEKAAKLLDIYNSTFDKINSVVNSIPVEKKVSAIASSMTGYISGETSDYQLLLNAVGADFGLKGYDFGTSASIKVADNAGIYDTSKYNWTKIVHLRTGIGYATDMAKAASEWNTYTSMFSEWEHYGEAGSQVVISGAAPIPVRAAYALYAIYGDILSDIDLDWANGVHQSFITGFFDGANANLQAKDLYVCISAAPSA